MTLVACWLDESFGQLRISAIADARASEEVAKGSYVTLSNLTQKLFLVDVECYAVDGVAPGTDALPPYHRTKIGIGFSGHCFEALTVLAYITRSLRALVDVDGRQLRPEPAGIVELARQLVALYLLEHSEGDARDLDLLMFGFDDDRPWVAKIHWEKARKTARSEIMDLAVELLVAIGDATSGTKVVKEVERLRRRLSKEVAKAAGAGDVLELRRARLGILRNSSVVAGVKKVADNEMVPTVGGALQKIELIHIDGSVLGAYVKEKAEHILNRLPSVNSSGILTPLPIEEAIDDSGHRR